MDYIVERKKVDDLWYSLCLLYSPLLYLFILLLFLLSFYLFILFSNNVLVHLLSMADILNKNSVWQNVDVAIRYIYPPYPFFFLPSSYLSSFLISPLIFFSSSRLLIYYSDIHRGRPISIQLHKLHLSRHLRICPCIHTGNLFILFILYIFLYLFWYHFLFY